MSPHLSRRISAQLEPFLLITVHLKIDAGSKAISSSIPALKSPKACVTWQALSKVPVEHHAHSEATFGRNSPVCNVQSAVLTNQSVRCGFELVSYRRRVN